MPDRPIVTRRILGTDAARAVGRFRPGGVLGWRASTMPDAPLRQTRSAAEADERRYLDRDDPADKETTDA